MKLYTEPVQVELSREGKPTRIVWRLKIYKVLAVHESWHYCGRWWTTPRLRGRFREYHRVSASTHAMTDAHRGVAQTMEIYREAGRWVLSRMVD
jgi:hypothetical protein